MPGPDEEKRREDLTATAESLKHDARRLFEGQIGELAGGLGLAPQQVHLRHRLQHEIAILAAIDIDDPKLDELSKQAEQLAGDVQRKSRVERALSDEGPTEPDEPGEAGESGARTH